MNWPLLANIATVISSLAIIVAVTQLIINRKQLYRFTAARCIDKFRDLENLKTGKEEDVLKYVDLVNEELFYMQHSYIPNVVSREWLDGMLDYLPVHNHRGEILNARYIIPLLAENSDVLIKNYTRIKYCMTLQDEYE